MTPPPWGAPDPHSRRFPTGVAGLTCPAVGLVMYSWSRDMAPWNMFPPVKPNILSRSGGGRTSLPTILSLNPGAYISILSNTVSAYASLAASSHAPVLRWYGAYWVNIRQTWWPAGARVGSRDEGIVISIIGF